MTAVEIVPYREAWQAEYEHLAARLRHALGPLALRVDHVGSTAVPGLPAKDVIDVQVLVATLAPEAALSDAFARIGFRLRPGAWNRHDHLPSGWRGARAEWAKLVFGPVRGERPSNVHVRVRGHANARYALLFRDYLRAERGARLAWGTFKQRLAEQVPDLATYGQVKDPATDVLLLAAEGWAARVGWAPDVPA